MSMIRSASVAWFVGVLIFAAAIVAAAPQSALAGKKIEWKNLLPQLEPLKDPLTGLTQDQRFDVETIAWVRTLTEPERKLVQNQQGIEDAKKYERQFKQAGINVDDLLVK